jgi:aspartate dehydrogenase
MKIGIIGFGSIGGYLAANLKGEVAWVVDSEEAARKRAEKMGFAAHAALPAKCSGAELVVEAASQKAVPMLEECLPFCDVMVMSVGAFEDKALFERMTNAAKKFRRKIYIPSGAVGGTDAVAAVGKQAEDVLLETTKPPSSLGRSDSVRTVIFEGNAAEACRRYPQNVNVSATLSLAGIGFEKTKVRIVSDPAVSKNTHRITVDSPAGRMSLEFENLPSSENPKTSALAAMAALNRIRKIEETLQIG